ncbi:DUF2612 domain-containing protein [Methylorubrum populi]|uniref:DUF2612 domain-containing protein n=1 Tax=Methylorubrum populi TaxID=223967 RepID=A0A833N2X8_9HYPH|nr:DUF2612 domain-containing protein [Methylorubrum populi]KAB7788053.1 hypothetical protein F8B43_0058 [Methylorubrum populi]
MSRTIDTYVGRITPWQSGHARFEETVRVSVTPVADAGAVVASVPAAFDLDVAIGVQLDATGAWVGRDRNVRIPIPNAYFSLDIDGLGLDQGVWKEAFSDATAVYRLDDDVYRRLLKTNILAKRWDGTIPGAQAVFDSFFIDPSTHVFVQDNAQVPFPKSYFSLDVAGLGLDEGQIYQPGESEVSLGKVDVSMTIGISGHIPPVLYLGLLAQGAIPIKPGGVTTDYAVTSSEGAPLFGFDVENQFVSGLDVGAIGVDPTALLSA